jgi:RNA polymerase sigma-70 factor, ECF subfamily
MNPDRRKPVSPNDERNVDEQPAAVNDRNAAFLAFYDEALPHVYRYLSSRCGQALAEDLTAETFLAAVDAVRRDDPPPVGLPWIMGVARHKLVDLWRRQARQERGLRLLADPVEQSTDPWDARLDRVRAHQVLAGMATQHRAALTLRYIDDLPVPEVASLMGRSVHATEALLVRARSAFRRAYCGGGEPDA